MTPNAIDTGVRSLRREWLLFHLLLPWVFSRVLYLHWFHRQDAQFSRLGRTAAEPCTAVPEFWALKASNKIARLIVRLPVLRRRPCYWRSQMIYDLLPRFGFPVTLHLGARPSANGMSTHLWVTLRGCPVIHEPIELTECLELTTYHSASPHD